MYLCTMKLNNKINIGFETVARDASYNNSSHLVTVARYTNYNGNRINRIAEAKEQVYTDNAKICGKLSRDERKSKYNNK